MLAGGVSINMVTKAGGNQWRGNARYSFANDDLQSENWADTQAINPAFLGNPTKKTYDFNLSGGGALKQNRVWVNGTYRKWVVNKLVNARNPDGSQALDDNDLKNYSGKIVAQISPSNKIQASYLWNDKIRGHRRDTPPNIMEDIASLVQTNPVQTTQAKYTGIRNRAVFESNFSVMDGQTNYTYQPGTPADAIRRVDNARSEAFLRRHPRRAPAQLAPPVRQRHLDRQERLGRRAPVQGRRAVGPALLRVGLLGAGRPLRRIQ